MSWIIKLNDSEKYVYSKRLMVSHPEFERKFATKEQARVYIRTGEYSQFPISITEYTNSTVKNKKFDLLFENLYKKKDNPFKHGY